jgi:hypothetical protein
LSRKSNGGIGYLASYIMLLTKIHERFPTQLFLVLNPSVRSCGSFSQSDYWSEDRDRASGAMERGLYEHMIQKKSLGQSAPWSQLVTDAIGQQGQSARRRVQYGKSAQHWSLAPGERRPERGPKRGPERGQRLIGRGARTATDKLSGGNLGLLHCS